MAIEIKKIVVGKWSVNCYLISDGKDAILIDPGDDCELIIRELKLVDFNLNGIFLTHGHFDHIGGIFGIVDKFKTKLFVHSKDERLIKQVNFYKRLVGDSLNITIPSIDEYLDDKFQITLKNSKIFIHHIPGHTAGSVCFELENNLFSGDIILGNKIGRTDLPGGNKSLLLNSIDYVIKKFKNFKVHPGHGDEFFLDENLITNIKIEYGSNY